MDLELIVGNLCEVGILLDLKICGSDVMFKMPLCRV